MKDQIVMGIYPGFIQKSTDVTFRCSRCKEPKLITGRKRRGAKELKLGWLCADCIEKDSSKCDK